MAEVLQYSKELLLQLAAPDAIIRLKCTPLADQQLEISTIYSEQCHGSIGEFLNHHMQNNKSQGLLLQVLFYSFYNYTMDFYAS